MINNNILLLLYSEVVRYSLRLVDLQHPHSSLNGPGVQALVSCPESSEEEPGHSA